jgi:hypothetical protein
MSDGPVEQAAVDYANSNDVILGAPALWIADQLRAAGFRYVKVVDTSALDAEDVDALLRTFRWTMGLPIS